MRLGFYMGYAPPGTNPLELIELAQEAERLGYDSAWAAEAWGTDAVTVLAWLGATTERIKLGSAILQMPGRTPALTAMTAATLDLLSGGRLRLDPETYQEGAGLMAPGFLLRPVSGLAGFFSWRVAALADRDRGAQIALISELLLVNRAQLRIAPKPGQQILPGAVDHRYIREQVCMAQLNRVRLQTIHKPLHQEDALLFRLDQAADQAPKLGPIQLFKDDLLRRSSAASLKAVTRSLAYGSRALDVDRHAAHHTRPGRGSGVSIL